MPNVDKTKFTERGWKEHYSGFPADLFFALSEGEPWAVKPHMHVNYAMGGALQSVTYKNASGTNTQLFISGAWNEANIMTLPFNGMRDEVTFMKGLE